jgi:Uma2 family endonuclease
MGGMEQLFEQLLRSPKLEIYFERIGATLAREKSARQLFLEQINEDDKAEFINGHPIFHSPVKFSHANCSGRLHSLLQAFVHVRQLGAVGYEKLMISLTRNDYEPDLSFWNLDKSAHFQPNQMRFPAPDWIAEVLSPSTEANDRGVKFEDYAAHGVSEYWLVDPEKQFVEQYVLGVDGTYELRLKSDSGFIRSSAIAGFEIPIAAIFDDAENLRTLKAFLA